MKKIAPDKWKHFIVGIGMGIFLEIFFWILFPSKRILVASLAFAMVIIISYGFELYSKLSRHGHYDVIDAIAGVIGGAIGMAIGILILFSLSAY